MRLFILLAAGATAFAQIDTGAITIHASRNVSATQDQLQYSVTLRTEASVELSDVVARLTGTGITASDLSYVSSTDTLMNWTFNLVTPFSKMSEMNATLTQLRTKLGRVQFAPAMDFSVSGTHTSATATAQACPLASLVTDARKEADRIATAAGVHAGAIISLSDGALGSAVLPVPTAVQRSGDFSLLSLAGSVLPVIFDPATGTGSYTSLSSWLAPPAPPIVCSLIVQFRIVP